MRNDLNTADRVLLLLSLVPYLREHGPTPITELAEAFDVKPQLLRRLIRFLGTAGVPGETQTYQAEDLFDIDWDALEHHDTADLLRPVVVDDTPRFAPAETAALIAGLQALTTMLPEPDAQLARETAHKLGAALGISAESSDLTVTAEPQDARLLLAVEALQHQRQLLFVYRDSQNVETQRRVDPLRLTQGSGLWYLSAHCHDRNEERTFRVDRMSGLSVTEDAAERRSTDEPQQSTRANASIEAAPVKLQVRVREASLSKIARFQPELVQPLDDGAVNSGTPRLAPGWIRAAVHVGFMQTAVALVQQAPGDIVIEAPDEARAAVHTWAQQALAQREL